MKENSNPLVTEMPSTAAQGAATCVLSPEGVSKAPGPESGAGNALPGAPPKRRPGRPKGYPKTGGRKPGTPNKLNADVRQYILDKGKPLEFLFSVALGRKIKVGDADGKAKKVYPSLVDRALAARALLAKCLPDMKATELTGADGGPISTKAEGALDPMAETARRLAFMLAGVEAANSNGADPKPSPPKAAKPRPEPVAIEAPKADEQVIDPLRLSENQRPDNRATPPVSRPQVITRRR